MPNKMERFTQRARRVLGMAQEESERLQHGQIGTEHLLLGLMREEGGVAGRVLRELGLDPRRVEELIVRHTDSGERKPGMNLELSMGTKRVLELAVDEARRMGHHYIGTEHLLLGLVRHQEGIAIDVLRRLGVTPEEVRRQTRRVLQDSPMQSTTPPSPQVERAKGLSREIGLSWQRQRQEFLGAFKLETLTKQFRKLDVIYNDEKADDAERNPATGTGSQARTTPEENQLSEKRSSETPPPEQPALEQPQKEENLSSSQKISSSEKTSSQSVNPNRMERFTQRARRVLGLAQEEAERLQHGQIGVEHVLLGLMREEGGVAGRVLRELGLDPRRVEDLVVRHTDSGERKPGMNLELSVGTKKVLELTADEARRMGHHYIGTEHLLLGLVRQQESIAVDVMRRLGVAPEEVRRQTRRVLQESPMQSTTPPPPPIQATQSRVIVPSFDPSNQLPMWTEMLTMLEKGELEAQLEEEVSRLEKDYKETLKSYIEECDQHEKALGSIVHPLMKNINLPMRSALEQETKLLKHIKDNPGWRSVITAIYGGYANYNTHDVLTEYDEMKVFLAQDERVKRDYIENEFALINFRWNRWKGSSVVETLKKMSDYITSGMDGQIELTALLPAFSPLYIWRDSPLTGLFLSHLRRAAKVEQLIQPLQRIVNTPGDPVKRADAIIALMVLGQDMVSRLEDMRVTPDETETMNAVLRRLESNQETLEDAVARCGGHSKEILTSISTLDLDTEARVDAAASILGALVRAGHTPIPVEAPLFETTHRYIAAEVWAYLLAPYQAKPAEFFLSGFAETSQMVDTLTGLTSLHLSHNIYWEKALDWSLEVVPPLYNEEHQLEQIGDLLTLLGNVDYKGFGTIVLEVVIERVLRPFFDRFPELPTEILTAFLPFATGIKQIIERIDPDLTRHTSEALEKHLFERAEKGQNLIIKCRVMCRFAKLYRDWGSTNLFESVVLALDETLSPLSRLRILEQTLSYVEAAHVIDVKDRIRELLPLLDANNRARALARLAWPEGTSETAERLLQESLDTIEQIETQAEAMEVLRLIRPLLAKHPHLLVKAGQLYNQPEDYWLKCRGRGLSSMLLLPYQNFLDTQVITPELWTPLLVYALSRETVQYFSFKDTPEQMWRNLLDEKERDQALEYLFDLYKQDGVTLTQPIAEIIDRLVKQEAYTILDLLFPLLQNPKPETHGLIRSWMASEHDLTSCHAALLLAEGEKFDSTIVQNMIRLLETGSDRARIRTTIALHGGWVSVGNDKRQLRTSLLGQDALDVLIETQQRAIDDNNARLANLIIWTWHNIIHDDVAIMQKWLHDAKGDNEHAQKAQLALGYVYEVTPEVGAVMLEGIKHADEKTQINMLKSFSTMSYGRAIRLNNLESSLKPLIDILTDDQKSSLSSLPSRANNIKNTLRSTIKAFSKEKFYDSDMIESAASLLSSCYITIQSDGMRALGEAGVYKQDEDAASARAVASEIVKSPEEFELLIHWLAHSLKSEDKTFSRHTHYLLEVAAACVQFPEMISAFMNLARTLDLEKHLVEAACFHRSFFGRTAAIHLLGSLRKIKTEIDTLLFSALRDTEDVQSAALEMVANLSHVDESLLPRLTEQLTNNSAAVAYAAVQLLSILGRNERLSSDHRQAIIRALTAAVRTPNAKRPIYYIKGGKSVTTPYRAFYRSRLDGELYHALSHITGIFD